MYGEERKTIERLVELVEDSNRILHRLQRAKRWGTFFHFLYWVVILLLAAGSYYYIQPYVDDLQTLLPQLEEMLKTLPLPGLPK
ncbi:MAG TPA: hypothetical protein VJB69_02235 [Candidatus Paceibacterota bacterium]